MKDAFTGLVARAWDLAPRARPQLAPRFAQRVEPLRVEEAEREDVTRAASSSSASSVAGSSPGTQEPARAMSPHVSARDVARSETTSATPHSAVEARDLQALPARDASLVPRVHDHAPAAAVHSVEHVIETRAPSERSHDPYASQPVALSHARLNAVDVERFRPLPPTGYAAPHAAAGVDASAPSVRHASADAGQVDPVEIFIGRIDVRANALAPSSAAPTARMRATQAPLSLNDYLNGKRDDR